MGRAGGWESVRGARLPASAIDALAALRRESGVALAWEPAEARAWVEWSSHSDAEAILRALRPVRGIEFFERRDDAWHPFGRSLPAWDVPPRDSDPIRLDRAIIPGALVIEQPSGPALEPVELRLVPDDRPRPATAARGRLEDLARWADSAPTARIEALEATVSGDSVLVRSRHVGETPAWRGDVRFWGRRVLIPLGFRVEPGLSESGLCEALGMAGRDRPDLADDPARGIVLFDQDGVQWIESSAFRTLSRASCRLSASRSANEGAPR